MDANRNFVASVADHRAQPLLGLTRGKVARIEDGRGVRVRVESGSVWLTQAECAEDVILEAGTSYCIERAGLTLLTNFGKRLALVTIEPAPRAKRTLSARFWSFWSGLYVPQSRPTTAAL